MTKGRIYVDFNEMVAEDIVLLSKEDFAIDSLGERISLFQGKEVDIYSDDVDDEGRRDDLMAHGIAIRNETAIKWTLDAKWLCKIDEKGIYNESQLKKTNNYGT